MVPVHKLLHGILYFVLSSIMTYYFYQIRQRLISDTDVALSQFFLDADTADAFHLLTVVAMAYAAAILIYLVKALYGGILGLPQIIYSLGYTAAGAIALLAIIHFQRSILRITARPGSNDQ